MLRPATDDDQHFVLAWRNHPDVRAVSLTQHVITPEEHQAWWESTKTRPDREVFIYERRGEPAAVVTFFDLDREARTSWWGYYLDNEGLGERGVLMPVWMHLQREGVKFAWNELGLDVLEGEVLAENEAVRAMNLRGGFVEVGSDMRDIGGRQVEVLHIRAERPADLAGEAR